MSARSQIYSSSEERWYGPTIDGAYACKLDAKKAGYRAKAPQLHQAGFKEMDLLSSVEFPCVVSEADAAVPHADTVFLMSADQ